MDRLTIKWICLYIVGIFLVTSCSKQQITLITPENGYQWPSNERPYWPTNGWKVESLEAHGMDVGKMALANQFAKDDPFARALLVIKDGYLVYENYYQDGGVDKSTNLWSVTKSFSSALVGILVDQGTIQSTDQRMAELMPDYPEFGSITLDHVLTQSTGLSWEESGPLWVEWIFSDDWVTSALARGQVHKPGSQFYYSSGNSHFLSALVYYTTGITPGKLAKDHIFSPLGIPFDTLSQPIVYTQWDQYKAPLYQTWRRDPKGIECASFGLYLRARDMAKFGFLYLNRGKWEDQQLISKDWVEVSTRDHQTNIYGRYSYGYQWYLTMVGGYPAFLASGFGGQIIGVVPSLDLVVVLKYEAENPVHPQSGTGHDDMQLFELVVNAVN